MKKQRNIREKSEQNLQNGDFRHISGIFGRKKIFLKNRGPIAILWALLIGIFLQKIRKKLMMKSRENVKKTGFSGIFPVFSAGKKFFPEIGLRHILGTAILHLCAKNQKKLMTQSREKLVTDARTDGRTNGQRLIYRTSKVGPKKEYNFSSLTNSSFQDD